MNPFKVKVKNPDTQVDNEVEIVEHIPTKGRGQGRPKLHPKDLDKWTAEDVIKIFGGSRVMKVLILPRFKQLLSNFSYEALIKSEDANGIPVPETDEKVIINDYSEMFDKLSFRGYTMTDIKERMLEITGDVSDPEVGEGELSVALNEGNLQLAQALGAELKQLRADFFALKRKGKSGEAAKPTAAPAVA